MFRRLHMRQATVGTGHTTPTTNNSAHGTTGVEYEPPKARARWRNMVENSGGKTQEKVAAP